MKKYFSILLLFATICFCSCEKENPAKELVGTYSALEVGVLSIAGGSQSLSKSGEITITSPSVNKLNITIGEYKTTATLNSDYTLSIQPYTETTSSGSITIQMEHNFSNARYNQANKQLTLKDDAYVIGIVSGTTYYGTYQSSITATRK